ncbi:MAG: BrnA antitoxin family protein [Burkholderiales bacterium]
MKFKLDIKNAKPVTAVQRRRLTAVAAMPDTEIDYSDIPRQTRPVLWTRPSALVPTENKQQITLRLDADVVSFFKKTGKRYQSRINAALREYVKAHRKSA